MNTSGLEKHYFPLIILENVLTDDDLISNPTIEEEFFALYMFDGSMEPRILKGDTVIVKNQNAVENGDVALVLVNNKDLLVRRVRMCDLGMVLSSFNTNVDPLLFTNDQIADSSIRILGRVIECRSYLINGVI